MKHKDKVKKHHTKAVEVDLPELLVPAGSPAAFMAALSAGADAIYLGLNQFSARNRAKNFFPEELPALAAEAQKTETKIYIAVNTLIKNSELKELLIALLKLEKLPIDGIIIQDLGLLWILRKYFPSISIHASTQMGSHNSLDADFWHKQGFKRVILARELSLGALRKISQRSMASLEVFIHGALCYSFSGQCLMSSYLGGDSANRGLCRQPCRRVFEYADTNSGMLPQRNYCMKDLQLSDYVHELCELGIASLKIEGRMRSPEYVYQVAKSYRMLLDDKFNLPKVNELLCEDGGRDKTSWNIGTDTEVLSQRTQTGILMATAQNRKGNTLLLKLLSDIHADMDFYLGSEDSAPVYKVDAGMIFTSEGTYLGKIKTIPASSLIAIKPIAVDVPENSSLYRQAHNKTINASWKPKPITLPKPEMKRLETIYKQIRQFSLSTNAESHIYFRITDPQWIPFLEAVPNSSMIMDIGNIPPNPPKGIIAQTPMIIPENKLSKVKNHIAALQTHGIYRFCISSLTHLDLIDRKNTPKIVTNEHVYTMNDAAIRQLRTLGVHDWVLPFENDFPNAIASGNRDGILPIYFHPVLFTSAQKPIKNNNVMVDNETMIHFEQAGQYCVRPQKACALFNFIPRLLSRSYHKFMIDLSFELPDQGLIANLLSALEQGKNPAGTGTFNFKKGLH